MALILDTGPLSASLDRSDADHAACRRLIEEAEEPLVIPAPVLVEVDYWIHTRLHPGVLVALLDDIEAGAYRVEDLQSGDYARVRSLCVVATAGPGSGRAGPCWSATVTGASHAAPRALGSRSTTSCRWQTAAQTSRSTCARCASAVIVRV